jgi:hypothetical protein
VLPITEQIEQDAPAPIAGGGLLTGDLGVVVLRALLENGVGYVVSSWRDRQTPIDAAIDDARDRVLAARGVVLRRLRSLAAIEPIVTAPTGGVTGEPPRGAIIFAGRRGLRPALEQFLQLEVSGSVVAFCFDEDALRIEDSIVIDPEPTATGLARAIDAAFTASLATGRPALVVLRERSLGMRGTMRVREELSPVDASRSDAELRASEPLDVAAAAAEAGLIDALVGARGGTERVVFVAGPMRVAAERALATLDSRVAETAAPLGLDDVAIVATRAVGIVPDATHAAGHLLAGADDLCVLATNADRVVERLRAAHAVPVGHVETLDPGAIGGDRLVAALARWVLAGDRPLDDAQRDALELIAASPRRAHAEQVPSPRLPRRGDVLHRSVSPIVAAGLSLAQGVIGVPGRIDPAYPTYRTDTGVPLTVAPAATFAAHGIASAAPDSGIGVIVLTGSAAGVMEAAGAAGASIETVDGSSPRAIAVAIGKACRSPRSGWHVVLVGDVQRIAAPRTATFGMDPDLVGTERIATSAVPTSATVLVMLDDELASGPAVLALDRPDAHAALAQVRDLSPATWDLTSRAAGGRGSRFAWSLRRHLVRSIGGVEL